MAIAESYQDSDAHRVARHFAAQAQIDTKTLGVMSDHCQRPQYRRMQAVVHIGDAGIIAVDREDVLRQVIGADRDKVDTVCQLRQHKDH